MVSEELINLIKDIEEWKEGLNMWNLFNIL